MRQLITMTQKSVICLEPDSGKMLWSYPHVTPNDQNITTPIFHEGHVFVSSGHLAGSCVLRINDDLHGVTEVWSRKQLDNCHGGVILAHGLLFGSACRIGGKTFFCADFYTGQTRQADASFEKLSLTYADGMLYALSHRGKVQLLAISPEGYRLLSQFKLPRDGRDDCLTHPVVCGGRLYIRDAETLYAYDVSDR